MELVYPPVVGAFLTVFHAMGWRFHVEGVENVPLTGPAVIASNHIGYLDFTFLGYGVRPRGRRIRFLAKKEIFDHPLAGPLMRGMRHVPVDRFGRATDAMDAAVASLRAGEIIGMFPEATISRSFVPRPGKSGAARMAMAAGAPLIPSAVWGSQRLLTKGRPRNWQRGVAISVAFGPPIRYTADDDPGDVTKRLMTAIADMVDRLALSYPQQPVSEEDRWWLPAHLGGTAPTVEEADRISAQERAERRARRRQERGKTP